MIRIRLVKTRVEEEANSIEEDDEGMLRGTKVNGRILIELFVRTVILHRYQRLRYYYELVFGLLGL